LVLMIGALLLIKSLDRLLQVNPGFEPEHVLTMHIALPPVKYSSSHPEFRFYQPVLENIDTLPGVQTAGLISLLPIQSYGSESSFQIAGRPKAPPSAEPFAEARAASPGYFRTLGIPLLRGRYFTEQDDATAPVAVLINKALADEYFANEDPVGKQLVVDTGKTAGGDINMSLTIVGVVGNTRQFGLAEAPRPELDICFLQANLLGPLATKYLIQTMSLVVRTTGDPTAVSNAVREAILRVDPDQPVFNVQTMQEVISTSINSRRFEMLVLGSFAAVGLALAILGIYGVISYGVRQRTHEIGIRMALGAQRSNVLNMVIGDGIKLALIGTCVGVLGALALMRFLSSLLYGVAPTDPITFVSVIILLLGVAVLACYIPARTATKIDPTTALRHE
jgi:putative ABC transport system permease protein